MFKRTEENMVILVGIGVFIILVIISVTTNLIFEDNVWFGMSCDEMIDWSGTTAHQELPADGHMKFHNYYAQECNGPLMNFSGIAKPIMNMNETITIIASTSTGE